MIHDLVQKDVEVPNKIYQSEGCMACGETGFLGRTAVAEVMKIDEHMVQTIRKDADATQIKNAATDAGMRTMWEDGLEKVFAGQTTLQELMRSVRAD